MEKTFKISKKALEWAVIFGFICAVFWSFADFNASCEELRHNILRLHIVANSDTAPDQSLKLKVRDAILKESQSLFEAESNLETAVKTATQNLPRYKEIAAEVIKNEGYDYPAEVKIGKAFFETRVYDDFTLPGGEYISLIINIGKAQGKNWWCVIFPGVCLPTAEEQGLDTAVSADSAQIAQNPNGYVIRFKTVEIYEKLKKWIA